MLRKCAALLGVVVLILGFTAVRSELRSRNEFRALLDQTKQLEMDIQNLRSTQKEMQDWLETPQVTQIRKRSALLNSLISQKSLSWTRMFQDLEGMLPSGVRITGIAPQSEHQNEPQTQPEILLGVSAPTIGPIVDFIKRLEDSPKFDDPVVGEQAYPTESEENGEIRVTLSARYVQSLEASDGDEPGDAPDDSGAPADLDSTKSEASPKALNQVGGASVGQVASLRASDGTTGRRQ